VSRRVPLDQPLWRPERYLGSESREERSRMADFLHSRVEPKPKSLAMVVLQDPDSKPLYMAAVRRRILGEPEPQAVPFKPRAAGDR
jgi:hypothetical protein